MADENKPSERYKIKQMQKWLSPDPLPNVRSLFIAEQKALLRLALAARDDLVGRGTASIEMLKALDAFDFEAD